MSSLLKYLPLLLLLSSCSLLRPRTEFVYRDSLRVEYRDSTIVRDSIVYVTLPDEHSSALTALGRRSDLETTLAASSAWVDSLGLHHELWNKRKEWGVHVPVTTHIISDLAHSQKAEVITQTVREPAKLSWWDRVRIRLFVPLIILCLIGFRKEILCLIKNIVKFVC